MTLPHIALAWLILNELILLWALSHQPSDIPASGQA